MPGIYICDLLELVGDPILISFTVQTLPGSATQVEIVGYRDLTPDVTLGAAVPAEYGGADVEVTITNSGTVPYSYNVDIVAETADGATQLETTYASASNLAPGQQATVDATFFDDLPEGAVVRVASVSRYES